MRNEETDTDVRRGRNGRSVLVVDDEAGVRLVAKALLEHAGFSTLAAADGAEALAVLREHAGDVGAVLLDLDMPVMGGEEAFRELRRLRAGLPVIITSGHVNPKALAYFGAQDACTVLFKPYRAEFLVKEVCRALGG